MLDSTDSKSRLDKYFESFQKVQKITSRGYREQNGLSFDLLIFYAAQCARKAWSKPGVNCFRRRWSEKKKNWERGLGWKKVQKMRTVSVARSDV